MPLRRLFRLVGVEEAADDAVRPVQRFFEARRQRGEGVVRPRLVVVLARLAAAAPFAALVAIHELVDDCGQAVRGRAKALDGGVGEPTSDAGGLVELRSAMSEKRCSVSSLTARRRRPLSSCSRSAFKFASCASTRFNWFVSRVFSALRSSAGSAMKSVLPVRIELQGDYTPALWRCKQRFGGRPTE